MTGSLQKTNRSKYWYAVISVPDGKGKTKPKWISTRCTKKTEAREILRALINEYEEKQLSRSNQRSTNADTILFTDYMIKWHSTAVDGVMEDTTSDSYLDNIVNHILPYFKDQNLYLSEVKRSHIQSFIRDLHEHGRKDGKGGLKVTSIKKYVANISCAFEMAIGDELLDSNPCTHLKYPVDEAYEANYLKVDHLQELLRLVKGTSIESRFILQYSTL